MIWVAFGTGFILGVFTGIMVLDLPRELAVRWKSHSNGAKTHR
jgi:hypothetical protein